MHAYERWVLRQYLAIAANGRHFRKPPDVDNDFAAWIEANGRALGLPDLKLSGAVQSRTARQALWRAWVRRAVVAAREVAPEPSPLQRRVEWLGQSCGLDGYELAALGYFARSANAAVSKLVAAVCWPVFSSLELEDISAVDVFLGKNRQGKRLSNECLLVRLGLIDNSGAPCLTDLARNILSLKRLQSKNVSDLLLGKPAPATLKWDEFAHLGDLRDIAGKLVASAGALGENGGGANLLFYGPPGTGKTEFAKTLGAQLGFSVQFVGEVDENQREPNRRERIGALMIANAIGAAARKTILVVDEADDLFAGVDEDDASTRHGSKAFMNRLVEGVKTPTVWIANDIDRLGAAVVRRMNLVVRFAAPGLAVRKRMVDRIADNLAFKADDCERLTLARLPAPPALIENAIRSARRIDGGAEAARSILRAGLSALGGREVAAAPSPMAFDPGLSSADCDLLQLADGVTRAKTRALSFCLSGPPGTGKSAYARYLAERLDMEALEKRYSDLSSMWVGESEKAIARAFEEAADTGAFLILDEADSLLRDRSQARHSWEITAVNEMLTWMERHPLPFACTTNAPDLLDPATSRRFLFKVQFLAMTPAQIAEAFARAFRGEASRSTLALEGLTPGDFAVVARKAEALGETRPTVMEGWLRDEALAKPGAARTRIGF